MKLNVISALTVYQNTPFNCRRRYVTYHFNVSLNLFLSPDKSLIVFW